MKLILCMGCLSLAQCVNMAPKTGAAVKVEAQNETIQRAVQFVIKEKKLVSPVTRVSHTKLQVVAGYNSFFKLKLADGSVYDTVVYQDLKDRLFIMQFEKK